MKVIKNDEHDKLKNMKPDVKKRLKFEEKKQP